MRENVIFARHVQYFTQWEASQTRCLDKISNILNQIKPKLTTYPSTRSIFNEDMGEI